MKKSIALMIITLTMIILAGCGPTEKPQQQATHVRFETEHMENLEVEKLEIENLETENFG